MKKLAYLFGAALALGAGSQASAQDKVDFAKQIRPIFAETCYGCHGPEKAKAKLRLDSAEAIMKGSKEGPVLVKGEPEKSTLHQRLILPPDHDDIMPPSDEGKPLPKEQTDLIAKWIKDGADFGGWTADAAAAGAEGPKEIKLPEVAAADAAAMDKLRASGALVLPLAQGVNLLDVSFLSGGDKVTDAQLADLAPVAQQVYSLNLAKTKVTDSGLAQLAPLANLRVLHLENTAVSDAGLAHLKGLANLEYLNLYGTGVTDAGLAHIKEMKNLKALYLWQSKVTDGAVEELRKAMTACKIDNGWKEQPPAQAAK